MNRKMFLSELDICLDGVLKPILEEQGFLKIGKYKFERCLSECKQLIEVGFRIPSDSSSAVAYLFVLSSISFPEIEDLTIKLIEEKGILDNFSPAFKFVSGIFPGENGLKEWTVTDISQVAEVCQMLSDYIVLTVYLFLQSVCTCEDAANLISNNPKSMMGIRSYNSSIIISSAALITVGRMAEAQNLVKTVFLGKKGLEQHYSIFLKNMGVDT
jgi:hypothetical protein